MTQESNTLELFEEQIVRLGITKMLQKPNPEKQKQLEKEIEKIQMNLCNDNLFKKGIISKELHDAVRLDIERM